MAFYQTYKNMDGSFSTYNFTLSDIFVLKAGNMMIQIVGMLLFIIITPFFCLIFYFYEADRDGSKNANCVIGLLSSIYLLLDYHFGWLCWTILGYNFPGVATLIAKASLAMGIVYLFGFLFGKKLYLWYLNLKGSVPSDADNFIKILLQFLLVICLLLIRRYFPIEAFSGESGFWNK